MIKSNLKLFVLSFFLLISLRPIQSAEMVDPIKVDWSFKGLTGTFDRASPVSYTHLTLPTIYSV